MYSRHFYLLYSYLLTRILSSIVYQCSKKAKGINIISQLFASLSSAQIDSSSNSTEWSGHSNLGSNSTNNLILPEPHYMSQAIPFSAPSPITFDMVLKKNNNKLTSTVRKQYPFLSSICLLILLCEPTNIYLLISIDTTVTYAISTQILGFTAVPVIRNTTTWGL